MRLTAFIDGFNLYHAIDATGRHHLKWLDLRKLCREFAPSPGQQLTTVYYFSAYATWRPDAYARHRSFVAALEATSVVPVMGVFKAKDRSCRRCGSAWIDHTDQARRMKDVHVERSLLPELVVDSAGRSVARRPEKYAPPPSHPFN